MSDSLPVVDVVGVGLNATDTIIRLPHFPAFNSKVEFLSSDVLPGGQVASAMVACPKWGLTARYVGKIGDDAFGRLQRDEMERAGVESHWIVTPNCQSQSSYILVDEATGERSFGSAIPGSNFGPRKFTASGLRNRGCFTSTAMIALARQSRHGGRARLVSL